MTTLILILTLALTIMGSYLWARSRTVDCTCSSRLMNGDGEILHADYCPRVDNRRDLW